MRAKTFAASAAALAALALTACGTSADDTSQPVAAVSSTSEPGLVLDKPYAKPDLILTDTEGEEYDLIKETAGRPTYIFFGYTNCPDVCPTTMSDLAIAKSQLSEADQEKLRVVFITTDPERDTPERLGQWLDAQDPSFVGLTGDFSTIQAAALSVHVSIEQPEKTDDGNVMVSHGAQVITFSPKDDTGRVLYTSGTTADEFAADMPEIISGGTP